MPTDRLEKVVEDRLEQALARASGYFMGKGDVQRAAQELSFDHDHDHEHVAPGFRIGS